MHKALFYFIIIAVFLFQGNICSAQTPVLGTSSNYVLFSSVGDIGNTGSSSQFTGNMGTLSGAITVGVNVNGVLHQEDASATAAAADILLAYQQLQSRVPTDTQLGTTVYVLGNHDTLRAGVDSITLNTLLSDTLVLDGQNDANSVFIFKINGTLVSTAQSAVVLINGALACNVFWQVNGAISTAANTVLRGTFITNSAAIDLASGTILEGRALTLTAGPIATNNVLAYLPTGCGSPILTGPVAPALGAAACYALFTGNEANANTGITNVSGDVGTNAGSTTGYNQLLVNGTIHPAADGSTAVCAADLLTAYNYLNNLVPDIELRYPAQFGQNLVLTPRTYLLAAGTILTDTLYLNAAGNANAVFVFKIDGALSTSTFATVVLLNGAQSKNIFWKVEGATTINNYSIIKGTIIGNNGAINLNNGVNLDGRALTTNGAFSTASITATIPPLSCALIQPLPVALKYFQGHVDGNNVLLEWELNQINGAGELKIEKSSDARIFDLLANYPDSAKMQLSYNNIYHLADAHPGELNYYRLVQTGTNGAKEYSKTIQINKSSASHRLLMPYVDPYSIYINYADVQDRKGSINVYGVDGKRISTSAVELTKNLAAYKISRPLHPGFYTIVIESEGFKLATAKLSIAQ